MSNQIVEKEHYLYKELKELFRKDERIFEFIESASLDGMWFWDLENPENEWMSPAFWETLGYSPSSKKHLASEWQNIINQEDFRLAIENFEKHCANPDHPYDQVVRYTHKTGKTVWIRCRGMAVRDASGKAIRMFGAHSDITKIKEQEIERVKKEQKQKLAFQRQAHMLKDLERIANIGSWEVDLNTQKVWLSEQAKRIHEVPDDFELTVELGIAFYKEGESRRRITEAVELGIKEGTPWNLDLEFVTARGNNKWVRAQGKPLFTNGALTGLFGVLQDISHQKAIEAKDKNMRERAIAESIRLQLANDSIGMGVWEWDLTTNELTWDHWMYQLYGIEEHEFSGAFDAWESSVHPDDIERAKALLNKAISEGGTYDTEFRIIQPSGQIKYIKANGKITFDNGQTPIKVIGVNYDISEKVNTLNVLENEKLKAESAAQAKSDFLANMSHEIRTPMNAILGGLQLLKNSDINDNLREILDNAVFSGQSLVTIINDILDYSKIESNKLSIEQSPFSLFEVLSAIRYNLDTLVSNKGISLDIEIDESFVDGWVGDIVRVKQILLNLTSNAVKFTHKGTVKIEVSCCDYKDTQAIQLKVVDTGIGMSEEAQLRIFDRFSQADTSTTREYGGTGLGMSITKSLVKMMNGEIQLTSKKGQGTTVIVRLPLEQSELDVKRQQVKALTAPSLVGKKVLVAEDNQINQVVIQSMLEPTEATVTIVDNGIKAVDAALLEEFDLILMDIHMPEMDGKQAQQKIGAEKPHMPIVALTANVMPEDVADYLQQGFVGYLSKPVDINTLYGMLLRYCQSPM